MRYLLLIVVVLGLAGCVAQSAVPARQQRDAEQSRELLAAAARHALTFHILRRDVESPIESALFHAQQSIERGLKADLIRKGIIFRRTHDLLELCELAITHGFTVPIKHGLWRASLLMPSNSVTLGGLPPRFYWTKRITPWQRS